MNQPAPGANPAVSLTLDELIRAVRQRFGETAVIESNFAASRQVIAANTPDADWLPAFRTAWADGLRRLLLKP